MRCHDKILLLFLLWMGGTSCLAQSENYKDSLPQQQYEQQPVSTSSFDKKEWEALKQKLKIKDYEPEKKKKADPKEKIKKEKKEKNKEWELYLPGKWGLILKWVLFALLIGALLFLVLLLLGINPFNRAANPNKIHMALEELEEHLDTAAIDPHLYAAIKSKNYKLAIRLYYLMIIQKLALKEKITWKKYKTNKNYLYELRNKEEYPILKELTLTYERSWFGESEISEREYDRINPAFVNFLQNIR